MKITSLDLPLYVKEILSLETGNSLPKQVRPEPEMLASKCKCGEGWEMTDTRLCYGYLYYSRGRIVTEVFYRRCVNKKCELHFDGRELGIFNYSGHTLVSYTLLFRYLNSIKGGRNT